MNALVTPDGRSAVEFATAGSDTELTWHDLTTGVGSAPTRIAGTLTATALDPNAQIVALTATPAPGHTEIVIAGADGERFRRTYDAELLPEGFANAWESTELPIGLFVIEYLDRSTGLTGPRTYQVRVIDLLTGDLRLPLNLRNKGETVDEQMTGFARTHVTSERDGLLFTLYRGVNSDDSNYAFVHTLGFVNGVWCLDVPAELGLDQLPGGLALAPDGSRLFVGSANGMVAEYVVDDILNPDRLPVAARTSRAVASDATGVGAPALALTDDELILAGPSQINWLSRDDLTISAAVKWPDRVEALIATPNQTVLIATSGRLSHVGRDGEIRVQLDLPVDIGPVTQLITLDEMGDGASG